VHRASSWRLASSRAAANGAVVADCHPQRTGAEFLAFRRKAVKPHACRGIQVVLDNLSTHDTPPTFRRGCGSPNGSFDFHPGRVEIDEYVTRHPWWPGLSVPDARELWVPAGHCQPG
jgi:hypothetical protein